MSDEPRARPAEARAACPVPTSDGLGTAAVAMARWLLAGLLVVAVAAPLAATLLQGRSAYDRIHRGYPGVFTGAATTVLRAVADVSSALTVGALFWLLFIGRAAYHPSNGRLVEVRGWFTIRLVRWSSVIWLASAAGSVVFEAADSNGLGVGQFVDPRAVRFALFSGDFARAWMVTTTAVFMVWLIVHLALGWTSYVVAFWASIVGSLAPVVVGQVLVGPNHDFGGDAAAMQTVLTQSLLGVILVQVIRVASRRNPMPVHVASRVQLVVVAFAATVVCEVIVTWFKLAGTPILSSTTGALAIGRFTALGLLAIGLGLTHHRRRPVAGVSVAATGAMAFITVGGVMTRVWPPQFFVKTSISQIFLGFDVDVAPSFSVLVSHWRPNLLFGTLAFVAVTTYVVGLVRLSRRGQRWPALHTVAWVLGWTLVAVTTSSGFGKYSGPDFAVHMGVHMTLNMMAPIFIVLGGPITLTLRALEPTGRTVPETSHNSGKSATREPGLRERLASVMQSGLLRAAYHPLLVFALYVGSYYGLYLTGIFGNVMRFHWAHQLMNLHFLIVGCLYFGLVIGVDATPRKLPHLAKLGFLMAAMPFHAFFGVILMSSNTIIAETYYRYLDLAWATDLANTQRIAGGVAWAGGEIPLLIVVIVLAIQWAIQDGKEAKRIDRHLDNGHDDAHEAYNAMLQRLSSQHVQEPADNETIGVER